MYNFTPISLPNRSGKAALVSSSDLCWLFVDRRVELSPWLILRRESSTDDELEELIAHSFSVKRHIQELFDYFEIKDTSYLYNNQFGLLEDRIFTGDIQVIKLPGGAETREDLTNPASMYWQVARPSRDAAPPASVEQARAELVTELGSIMVHRWATYDSNNSIFMDFNWVQRRGIELVGAGVGVVGGASDFLSGLKDMAAGVLHAAGSIVVYQIETYYNLLTGQFDEIKKDIQRLYGAVVGTVQEVARYIEEGWRIVKLVYEDAAARDSLFQFLDAYKESMPHVSRIEALAKGAATIGIDVVLTIGLTALTGAGGLAYLSARVGAFTGRVVKLIINLFRKLENLAVRKRTTDFPDSSSQSVGSATGRSSHSQSTQKKPDHESDETSQPAAACTKTNGCPISMVSGEELLQHQDLVLAGPIPLVWERTYRSQRTHLSPKQEGEGLGHGWSTPASQRLAIRERHGEPQVVYFDQEGREIYFAQPHPKQPSVHTAEQLVLRVVDQDVYTLAPRNGLGLTRHFERQAAKAQLDAKPPIWKLTKLSDAFGNEQHWHYDAHNRLSRISTSCGQALEFEYEQQPDSQYLLKGIDYLDLQADASEGQAAQRLVSYTHDLETDDLLAVTDPNGLAERYTYKHHLFQTRILKTGHTLYFQWCPHAQYPETAHKAKCERQWSEPVDGKPTYDYQFEFTPETRQSTAIDTRGGRLAYRFNAKGLPLTLTDPEGQTTRYEYNDNGQLTRKVNPAGHSEYYEYNAKGHLQSYTNALGQTWQFKTNRFGQVEQTINPLGQVQSRRYNDQGQLIEQNGTRYQYNNQGQIQAITDPAGRTTRYIWNHRDMLQAVVHPNGQRTRYQYNKAANPQPIKITTPDANGQEQTTHYAYNAAGQCTQIVQADGKTTHYQYNANGLVEQVQNELEKVQYTYRGLSQVHTKTTWSRQPVAHHKPAQQTQYTAWQQTSQLHYEYDGERNLIGLTNEKGERYQLKYDGSERLIEEVGFDGRIQRYEYNSAGHLKAAIELGYAHTPAQSIEEPLLELARTNYKRDALGQLLELQAKCNIPGQQSQTYSQFSYDALGRLTQANNEHRQLSWQYNAQGQIERELQDQFEHRHEYNALGQRIKTHYGPQGGKQHTIDYQFDTSEQGTCWLIGMAHNGQQLIEIERNLWGQETQRQHSNLLTTENQFDPQGRLLSQRTFKESTNRVIERSYDYDALGRIEQIHDLKRGTTRYHYDALSRLKAVQGPVPEQFIFDPASNLLGMQSGNEEPANNTQGQSEQAQSEKPQVQGNRLAFQGDQHFQYDQLGRRTKKTWGKQGAFKQHYQYDAQHRLVQVVTHKPSQPQYKHTAQYTYDALGRRIDKTITKVQSNGPTQNQNTQFYWLGDSLFGEVAWQHNQPQTTVYLFEPNQGAGNSFKPVAKVHSNELYHYHLDHLGTPQEITNAQGQVVWAPQYKAYGNLALKPQADTAIEHADPLRFQGQYFDEETGLHYNRHRYYDPNCGQFITQDPIGLLGGLNCYQYVPNPVGWVDPMGLSSFDPFAVGEYTDFPADLHFGQDRIAPNFSTIGSQADSSIVGRPITDVAADLRAGRISPDVFEISYTIDPRSGKPVTLNNRGFAALVESGKRPAHAILVPYDDVPPHLVEDIKSRPPSRSINVTENKDGTGLLRVINIDCDLG